MDIDIADKALLIDDDYRPLRIAFRPEDSVRLRCVTMRVEVAQERICDAAQAVRPGLQAWDAVNTDAQDLGMDPIKPVQLGLVGWDLARSYRRPGQREKYQHYIAAPAVAA
jgi:hypothetical protein